MRLIALRKQAQGLETVGACERAWRIKHCGSGDKRYGILAALRVVSSSSLSLILFSCLAMQMGIGTEKE